MPRELRGSFKTHLIICSTGHLKKSFYVHFENSRFYDLTSLAWIFLLGILSRKNGVMAIASCGYEVQTIPIMSIMFIDNAYLINILL